MTGGGIEEYGSLKVWHFIRSSTVLSIMTGCTLLSKRHIFTLAKVNHAFGILEADWLSPPHHYVYSFQDIHSALELSIVLYVCTQLVLMTL